VVDEPDEIAFAATDKGIFKSTDLGNSFGPTNESLSACFGLAIDNVSVPHIVYANCDVGGIIASNDGFNVNFKFGTGYAGGVFGMLVDTSALGTTKPVLIGAQENFWSQLYESTDGGGTFVLNSSLGTVPDESIPVLLDPTTSPETIIVHDSWEHDVTITQFNPSGLNIIFSTMLGGSSDESGTGIALDDAGGVYVTGITFSTDFPVTVGAIQKTLGDGGPFGGFINGFVSKLTLDEANEGINKD
jgi:hypothetical protein